MRTTSQLYGITLQLRNSWSPAPEDDLVAVVARGYETKVSSTRTTSRPFPLDALWARAIVRHLIALVTGF
jgi:hypothetical protein